jgi:nitrogen fixation NifU-like protein
VLRDRQEAEDVSREFRGMMGGSVEPDEDEFGELIALKGVVKYPVRIKCAVLAWDVLEDALARGGQASAGNPHHL